jgi:hypothetical protein
LAPLIPRPREEAGVFRWAGRDFACLPGSPDEDASGSAAAGALLEPGGGSVVVVIVVSVPDRLAEVDVILVG